MRRSAVHRTRLALGAAVLSLLACNLQPATGTTPGAASSPERRTVQRSNLQLEEWQLVVCTEDPGLQQWADSLSRERPRGKTLHVVRCDELVRGIPAVIVGDRLPKPLVSVLEPVLAELECAPADRLHLAGYVDPRTLEDSIPTTLTLYLDPDPVSLRRYLQTTAEEGWWSIFGGQWAYRITAARGTVRLGDYRRGGGWDVDREREIVLPPAGSPVRVGDSLNVYRMDGAELPVALDELLLRIDALSDTNAIPSELYLYPSVERMGLRRGNMAALQWDADKLHVVAAALSEEQTDRARPAFYAGMTFAHEGYRVYNGYGGREVSPSLDSLSSLNVNAVAIVPYTYMPAANRTGSLPVPTDAGSENDAAVQYAIRQAHGRGWAVLLKPQIWVGGAWPGAVDFTETAEWEQFFEAYERWITHYARMAEDEGVAALCIGTELVHATLEHPDRWRAMIRRLRGIYSGQLTYAANWGQEFEQLSFWQDLDAVGLNSYYPLASTAEVTDAELLRGARQWVRLADSIATEARRPLWLTEVGYRSVTEAWRNPHAEAGDRVASAQDQHRCYRALLMAAGESTMLTGMFVWKWPSYLGYTDDRYGTTDRGFTPGGKPAAALLRAHYAERTAALRRK